MTLIWTDTSGQGDSLAALWLRRRAAETRRDTPGLPAAELGQAMLDATAAAAAYTTAAARAATAAADPARKRTHAVVVGVGRYDDPEINAVSTSVFGAQAFAEWLLTSFRNDDRPLGSIDLLLSPAPGMSDWKPSEAAAGRLGIDAGDSLPVEAATFDSIKAAFDSCLGRSGASEDNAFFFYFAGHGMWRSTALLLPQDAQLATDSQPFARLIDINQTEANLINVRPGVQCFFVDACQELPPSVLMSLDAVPGDPLRRPVNAAALSQRDAILYFGSSIQLQAYGPPDEPPFFTQALISCLKGKAAASNLYDNVWNITTLSLRKALDASEKWMSETIPLARDIKFSFATGQGITEEAELCQVEGVSEVFVEVYCIVPPTAGLTVNPMDRARLYLETGGNRIDRPALQPPPAIASRWYYPVAPGDCIAGAEFEPALNLTCDPRQAQALPTVQSYALKVQARPVTGGGT